MPISPWDLSEVTLEECESEYKSATAEYEALWTKYQAACSNLKTTLDHLPKLEKKLETARVRLVWAESNLRDKKYLVSLGE